VTQPEKFVNGIFTPKVLKRFLSVHTTQEKFENTTITGQSGFVFEKNLAREIT